MYMYNVCMYMYTIIIVVHFCYDNIYAPVHIAVVKIIQVTKIMLFHPIALLCYIIRVRRGE